MKTQRYSQYSSFSLCLIMSSGYDSKRGSKQFFADESQLPSREKKKRSHRNGRLSIKSTLIVITGCCCCCCSTSLSLAGNSGRLTCVRHSSRKSSATHSYHISVYSIFMPKQWYGCQCQCLGFLMCPQMFSDA